MSVDPDRHEEYTRRHTPIWPELEAILLTHGVTNYSIFLDERTSDLFAYVEFESEARWEAVAGTDVCRRWWLRMRDVMPSNPDGSPVARDLLEVFHLEAPGSK
jgi:L-rhamnose mutarotase